MKSKIYFIWIMMTILVVSCSKDLNTSNNSSNPSGPSTPSNEYAGYDFYVSYSSASDFELTKNFQKIIDRPYQFVVSNNKLYTFGANQYRSFPVTNLYSKSDNFSGFVSRDNVEIYSNIGGYSSAVYGIQEVGSDLYYVSGFKSEQGAVSVTQNICPALTWKNGVILDTLKGPFENEPDSIDKGKGYGIYVKNIYVAGNNVYVGGYCEDFRANIETSIGYWKNGQYNEVHKAAIINDNSMFFVNEKEDIYYYIVDRNGKYLFKNRVDIFNGAFNDIEIKDFAFSNDDVYIVGLNYDTNISMYKIGIYKNNILQFDIISDHDKACNIEIIDNRIFICGDGILGTDNKMSVFEYKPTSNTLTKVGNHSMKLISTISFIYGFQIVKK